MRYTIDPKQRLALNSVPQIAEARKGMADLYREMRGDGRPEMAQLMRSRVKAASAALARKVFDGAFSGNGDGLPGLLG